MDLFHRLLLGAALALPLLPPATARAAAPPAGDSLPVDIGVNVGGVDDYAVQSFFVDAMKQARHWGSAATPWDEAATVDALGWPTQDAGAVVLCCVADAAGNTELTGTYRLSFSGIASVALVAGSGGVTNMHYDAATNTSTADVTLTDSGAGTSLMLAFTGTRRTRASAVGSGVTDVSLIRPRLAPNGQPWWNTGGQVFTTPYLKLLRPFSTLRFMDFTATNSVAISQWSQRTTPQSATQQSPNGAAWEYAILLANTLHKDVWINVPDQADSDYVAQLATLFAATLDPSLHVWLEYSNEVWNFSFPQASRNLAAAEAIVAADPASPLAMGCAVLADCQYEWAARLVGLRAVQNGQVFRAAFGARAGMVRPVYATQIGQTWYVSLVLPMIAAAFGPPSRYLSAIAQAPYWAGDNTLDGLSATQELANAAANLATLAAPERGFAAWATNWGLRSVTYEGGPGMSGTASLDAKIAANESADMGTLVAQSLRAAIASGVSLYMYYDDAGQYGQYGMWGLTESVFDLASPKLQAVAGVMADRREALTVGSTPPASIAAGTPDLCTGSEWTVQGGAYTFLNPGGSCAFLLNIPVSGPYVVSLSVGGYGAATRATVQIDQHSRAAVVVPATGGLNWTATKGATLTLPAGLHMLTVLAPAAGFALRSVTVTGG